MSVSAKFAFLAFFVGTYISISDARGKQCEAQAKRPHREFTCDFMNRFYEMSPRILPQPAWGPTNVPPLLFGSTDVLSSYLQTIKRILKHEVEKNNFNNYDVFKTFYKYYEGLPRTTDFNEMIRRYRPGYRFAETDSGQSIAALRLVKNELKSRFPEIESSTFLCASVKSPSSDFVLSFNNPNRTAENYNYFNHVVGAIRFSIVSKKERLGYILFQPGDNIVDPILVMEDELPLQGAYGPYGEKKLLYSFLPRNKKFIVARSPDYSYAFWIYVGRPLCSFLDISSHYELFSITKKVFKRNQEGAIQGGFHFSIRPQSRQLALVYQKTEYPLTFVVIERDNIQKYEPIFNDVEKNVLAQIADLLGYSKSLLEKEFETIGQIIGDNEFLLKLKRATPSVTPPVSNEITANSGTSSRSSSAGELEESQDKPSSSWWSRKRSSRSPSPEVEDPEMPRRRMFCCFL